MSFEAEPDAARWRFRDPARPVSHMHHVAICPSAAAAGRLALVLLERHQGQR
jgi:hypothetical protein